MQIEERFIIFENELTLIKTDNIREFTKLCIASAPDYFFSDCPASSTGKHHPLNEISWDGTIIHTKKVFNLAYSLAVGLDLVTNRDSILSACLIHDLIKRGENGGKWVQNNHPQLAADLVENIQRDTQLLSNEEYRIIYGGVFYHYGPWTIDKASKPLSEYSLEELCVYISDYVASRRFLDIKYKDVDYE